MNIAQSQRSLRRFFETGWAARYLPKRFFLACCCFLVLIFIYTLFPSSSTNDYSACVRDQFIKNSKIGFPIMPSDKSVSFVGNGFIGIDAAFDKQLLVAWNNETSVKSPIYTAFRPLVEVKLPLNIDFGNFDFITDVENGMAKGVKCSVLNGKCICLYQLIYAHRTRPNLLIHEIRISNPTTSSIDFSFERKGNPNWEQSISGSLPVYSKIFDNHEKIILAVVCSSIPSASILVKPQTEENIRFLCVVEQTPVVVIESETITKRKLFDKASNHFSQLNLLSSSVLDEEHFNAWHALNRAAFNISLSKAPNALNADKINLTRYALLSTVRAPMIEVSIKPKEELKKLLNDLEKTELCYSGHSTLLMPSKLWQGWSNVHELLRTCEIWLMTLEHRGCVHMLDAGAHGVSQAFLLSLLAATFTHHRLESTLDPKSDLHRHIRVENLRIGSTDLSLSFDLDNVNRPFAEIHVNYNKGSNKITNLLYACSAGCLEAPKIIGSKPIRFAIKMTKPPTPILFIAESRNHLTQIKDTLHVMEVMDAPAPESHQIDLHKHGESGSLPTIFWVIFVIILIAFHAFLVNLLYSEWKNSSSIPYSKFNKRFLTRSS